MIIALTGHRSEDCEPEEIVRQKFRTAFTYATGIEAVICGMANGVDLWAGDEARLLGLELWAAKPWAGHTARKEDEQLYAGIIEAASRVVNVNEAVNYPGPKCYHDRNHWMVDNATHVLAYLNPAAKRGGTFECVKYARGKKPIRNIYTAAPF